MAEDGTNWGCWVKESSSWSSVFRLSWGTLFHYLVIADWKNWWEWRILGYFSEPFNNSKEIQEVLSGVSKKRAYRTTLLSRSHRWLPGLAVFLTLETVSDWFRNLSSPWYTRLSIPKTNQKFVLRWIDLMICLPWWLLKQSKDRKEWCGVPRGYHSHGVCYFQRELP